MNRQITEFVIYIINEVANRNKILPSKVYAAMDKTGCIDKYLVLHYEVLHTMSSESIVDDVLEYVGARGVAI